MGQMPPPTQHGLLQKGEDVVPVKESKGDREGKTKRRKNAALLSGHVEMIAASGDLFPLQEIKQVVALWAPRGLESNYPQCIIQKGILHS